MSATTKIYHLTYDDGIRADIEAPSASDAMGRALENYLGHRVVSCHVGVLDDTLAGWTVFEIPAHEPLHVLPRRPRKLPDRTVPMFPDAQPSAHRDA